MKISVIIPTYCEAPAIGKLIQHLQKNASENVAEIIVVDGGSNDGTLEAARAYNVKAVNAPEKGRAAQMNYGATLCSGDILYFVHADSIPPYSFASDIVQAVNDGFDLGRYRTKFDSHKWFLKINAWFTRFDWFICMGGDQTLFITRTLFEKEGGFKAPMKIMEEYEFVERARANGRYKIFEDTVLVSARKYDTNSWWKVQRANRKIVSMYRKGYTQQEMTNMYKKMLRYR